MKDSEVTSTAVTRAVDTLHAVLTGIGWEPREDTETAGFVVDFDPPYIPVAYAYAAISPDLEVFVFHLNFGVAAAASRREETARFLTLANLHLMVGNFEIDLEDGVVRFRSSLSFQGTELSEVLIRNVILCAMTTVERYAEGVIDVMARGKSAEDAFHEITLSRQSAKDPAGELEEKAPE
jgi:hypothetical protein